MTEFLDHLDDGARVLGYLCMATWVILLVWLSCKLFQEVRFDWRKKRREEQEWAQIREDWVQEDRSNEGWDKIRILSEFGRHDTDVLELGGLLQHHQAEDDQPETRPYEAVYDYQRELQSERPQRTQGGRKVRRR